MDFFKLPSTPHLALLGNLDVRGDKVMSEAERDEFLRHELIVEEKVDGANLGISFDPSGNIKAQNRGAYLEYPCSGQWKTLSEWLTPRMERFFDVLLDRYILFGEWCYAQHSILYDQLPDWLLCFDIYDKQYSRFLSCSRRDAIFSRLGVSGVPMIGTGRFSLSELTDLLSVSRLSTSCAEGIYMRLDKDGWCEERAKLVQPQFVQTMDTHWSKSRLKVNRLAMPVGMTNSN